MKFRTLAIHAGYDPAASHGAVVPPVVQSSTFAFKAAGEPRTFDYSRSGNPTRHALESCLAALEGGTRGFAFATGMAAELTALMLFNAGDTLLVQSDLYGGTYRLLTSVLSDKGIRAEFVDLRDPDDLGIDLAVHSTTKYINGHSDVVGGAIMTRSAELGEKLGYLQNALGTCASPGDCALVLRGLRTLAIRMEEHNRNALTVAHWLEAHPKILSVLHPGLPSHPEHELARRQMSGYGGTFSFRIRGGRPEAFRFLNAVRLFTLAESLGGVESLIEHPRSMTHLSVPPEILDRMGIGEDVIRISVGIEDVSDLVADLTAALEWA